MAAEDDDEKKKESSGGSMDSGSDPAYTETSDKGPYRPHSKTAEKKKGKKKQAEEVLEARPRDPMLAFADILFGFGNAPVPAPPTSGTTEDATLVSLALGGTYDVMPDLTAGLMIPWSTAKVDDPIGGGTLSTQAFGAPLLFGEYRTALSPITTIPFLFGLGVPIAQGDPDPSAIDRSATAKAQVNLLADAARGWRESELFWPKRFPIVLGVGIQHQRNELDLYASTKFVLGVNIGTDIQNEAIFQTAGTVKANGLALRNVTSGGVTYEFIEDPAVWVGLDSWLAISLMDPVKFESAIGATGPSHLQFVVEPRAGVRLGKLRLGLGYVLPLGGQLADAGISGVRLHAEYAF